MKLKGIATALLLAMSVSATAGAETINTTDFSNGYVADSDISTLSNIDVQASMLTVKPGDTMTFNIPVSGSTVTVASYSYVANEAGEVVNANLQYVNEYDDLTSSTLNFSYTVRDVDNGIYCIKISDANGILTYWYKVLNLTVITNRENFTNNATHDYHEYNNTTSYGWLATYTPNGSETEQSVNLYGLDYSYNGGEKTRLSSDSAARLPGSAGAWRGSGNLVFALTIKGIKPGSTTDTNTVDKQIALMTVTPFVNFGM